MRVSYLRNQIRKENCVSPGHNLFLSLTVVVVLAVVIVNIIFILIIISGTYYQRVFLLRSLVPYQTASPIATATTTRPIFVVVVVVVQLT